jgi:hypothetical protein
MRRRSDRSYADAGPLSAKLLKNGTLKTWRFPARHAHHAGRHDQRRPARIHQAGSVKLKKKQSKLKTPRGRSHDVTSGLPLPQEFDVDHVA